MSFSLTSPGVPANPAVGNPVGVPVRPGRTPVHRRDRRHDRRPDPQRVPLPERRRPGRLARQEGRPVARQALLRARRLTVPLDRPPVLWGGSGVFLPVGGREGEGGAGESPRKSPIPCGMVGARHTRGDAPRGRPPSRTDRASCSPRSGSVGGPHDHRYHQEGRRRSRLRLHRRRGCEGILLPSRRARLLARLRPPRRR